jgi:integrase/recombinase XerD
MSAQRARFGFCDGRGKTFHRKSASKILDRAIEAAKLEKRLTPHGLRHSFASLLLADGKPAPKVAACLGHKDCAVTLKVYAHFVREETQAIHNLAASILTAGQA